MIIIYIMGCCPMSFPVNSFSQRNLYTKCKHCLPTPILKGNIVIYNLASQRPRVQVAPCITTTRNIQGVKWPCYTLKIRQVYQVPNMLERQNGVYPFFPKKHYHHLIILLLVFGCAVCVQICVLLFCLILNQPTTHSDQFNSSSTQDFLMFCSTYSQLYRNLCFD